MATKKELEQDAQELAAVLQQALDQSALLAAIATRYEQALERIRSLPTLSPDLTDYHLWIDVQREMRAIAYEALVPASDIDIEDKPEVDPK